VGRFHRALAAGWAYARPYGSEAVDPEGLTVMAAAIANRERVRFRYRSHDGGRTRRHVDPHAGGAGGSP
jgi:predicted DNA-binding transcriptional regulator YafY